MKKRATYFILTLVISLITLNIFSQRFPAPEFENNYKIPRTQISKVQPAIFEYIDIAVFIGVMSLITWAIIKKRSRRMVFWISIFSLLYFGFFRKGCICPAGFFRM